MAASPSTVPSPRRLTPWLVLGVALAGLLWAYWPSLLIYASYWATDPSYSHGYLVPVFALALLWLRRDLAPSGPVLGSLWGWAILAVGLAGYLAEAWFAADRYYSLLISLAGVVVLVGGWPAWRWAWPTVLFLGYMIPLPWSIQNKMPLPLQTLATEASTFMLQTFGLPAVAEGNTIQMGNASMEIVEACSGLRMLMIFFALATAMALLIKRPAWEKAMLVASALPIALAANVVRITATGFLLEFTASDWAKHLEHDLAGWVMMPVALAMLGLEFRVLQWLQEPSVPALARAARPAPKPRPQAAPPERPIVTSFPVARPAVPPLVVPPRKVPMPAPMIEQYVTAPSVPLPPVVRVAPVPPPAPPPVVAAPVPEREPVPEPVAAPVVVEAPAAPRRSRKPWQPARSSVAAGSSSAADEGGR